MELLQVSGIRATDLVPIPQVLLRLQDIAQQAEDSVVELKALVKIDPVLSAHVLAEAHEEGDFSHLEEAFSAISSQQLSDFLIQLASSLPSPRLKRLQVAQANGFWQTSIACAVMCEALGRKEAHSVAPGAYLTGLSFQIDAFAGQFPACWGRTPLLPYRLLSERMLQKKPSLPEPSLRASLLTGWHVRPSIYLPIYYKNTPIAEVPADSRLATARLQLAMATLPAVRASKMPYQENVALDSLLETLQLATSLYREALGHARSRYRMITNFIDSFDVRALDE